MLLRAINTPCLMGRPGCCPSHRSHPFRSASPRDQTPVAPHSLVQAPFGEHRSPSASQAQNACELHAARARGAVSFAAVVCGLRGGRRAAAACSGASQAVRQRGVLRTLWAWRAAIVLRCAKCRVHRCTCRGARHARQAFLEKVSLSSLFVWRAACWRAPPACAVYLW